MFGFNRKSQTASTNATADLKNVLGAIAQFTMYIDAGAGLDSRDRREFAARLAQLPAGHPLTIQYAEYMR